MRQKVGAQSSAVTFFAPIEAKTLGSASRKGNWMGSAWDGGVRIDGIGTTGSTRTFQVSTDTREAKVCQGCRCKRSSAGGAN